MQLYEQTKPQDQQVIAAVKKRNRTKFRWGTSSSNSTKSRSSTHTVQASSSKSASSSSQPPSSLDPPAGTSSSSNTSSSGSGGRRSHSRRPPRLKPALPPIIESELEDHETDDDEEEDTQATASPTSSSSNSSLSLPAGSQYSFSTPDASFTSDSTKSTTSSLPEEDREGKNSLRQQSRYKPRVEYNLRKLLRQVMGLDGVWSCDQQAARHYARIKWGVVRTQADGNCLFRAISDQLYGSETFHGDIRRRVVEFIQREGKLFQPFIATEEGSAETLEQYCRRMKREGEWGGNPELYAAAKLFNVHIVVHQGPMRRVRIENGRENDPKIGKPPVPYKILHLLYKNDHYNSLRPPPVEDEIVAKEQKASQKLKGSPKQKHKSKNHEEQESVGLVVKRDRSPVNSPQNARRRQTKTHKIQPAKDDEKAQEMTEGNQVGDKKDHVINEIAAESQVTPETTETEAAKVEEHKLEQPETALLGTELQAAAFEVASVSVAVSKPTRVTFRRGKAHSICSSDDGSEASTSSSSSSSTSSSPSEPSAPVCPPTRKQITAEVPVTLSSSSGTSALAVAKAVVVDAVGEPVLLAEEEDPSSARVAFPNRLKFRRGVQQQQQQHQKRTHQPMTAAC